MTISPFPLTEIGPRRSNRQLSRSRWYVRAVTWIYPGHSVGLHAAGHVHGVAPQVVAELAGPDHPGHHRAGVHADANCQRPTARIDAAGHLVANCQRHLGHCLGVVGARVGQASGDHVGVADGLDLLQTLLLGEPVEDREQLIEGLHDLLWADPLAAPGEVHNVGEQDGDLGEGVGDHRFAGFEPGGDGGGQHV